VNPAGPIKSDVTSLRERADLIEREPERRRPTVGIDQTGRSRVAIVGHFANRQRLSVDLIVPCQRKSNS
jgi:hypothetical protein